MVHKIIQQFSRYTNISKKNNTDNISEQKFKGLSDELIKSPDNSLAPTLGYDSERMYLEFNGGCLKQYKITYSRRKIVNIYIVYDLKSILNYNEDFFQKIVCFVQLNVPKMLMLISTNILYMALDLMEKEFFHIELVVLVIIQ